MYARGATAAISASSFSNQIVAPRPRLPRYPNIDQLREASPGLRLALEAVEFLPKGEQRSYSMAKAMVSRWVGHGAEDERLSSSEAYEATIDYICLRLGV